MTAGASVTRTYNISSISTKPRGILNNVVDLSTLLLCCSQVGKLSRGENLYGVLIGIVEVSLNFK